MLQQEQASYPLANEPPLQRASVECTHANRKERKAGEMGFCIISRLSYSLFNANYSTRKLFLRARRAGGIFTQAHI